MENLRPEFKLKTKKYFSSLEELRKEFPQTYENKFTVEDIFITEEGLIGVIIMNSIGFRCGYVGVPPGVISESDGINEIDCHGGITHSGPGILSATFKVTVTEKEAKLLNETITFFGWDYGHLYDIADHDTIEKYIPGSYKFPDFGDGKHMYTTADVRKEVQEVSTQMSKMLWNDLTLNIQKINSTELKAGLHFSAGKVRFTHKESR